MTRKLLLLAVLVLAFSYTPAKADMIYVVDSVTAADTSNIAGYNTLNIFGRFVDTSLSLNKPYSFSFGPKWTIQAAATHIKATGTTIIEGITRLNSAKAIIEGDTLSVPNP